jgi:ribosomal protein S18 acetylase RimI-like enzyme
MAGTAPTGHQEPVSRPATTDDATFLRAMTFEALYVADDADPFEESVLDEPRIRHYFQGFGTWAGDVGIIAEDGPTPVGACWCRRFPANDRGYGWVSAQVPELSIAIIPTHRNRHLGTRLIRDLLQTLTEDGTEAVSLSVDPRSPAVRLYEALGFIHVGWEGTSMTMIRSLSG